MSKILKSLKRKITVLAVAMIAIQPVLVGGMMMPAETQAAGANPVLTAPAPVTVANNVDNLTKLQTALADTEIATINITADISGITEELIVGHTVTINGGSHTLIFTSALNGLPDGHRDGIFVMADGTTINDLSVVMAGTPSHWDGVYGIQFYGVTGGVVNNYTGTGADAALLVNGSAVTLTGVTTVSGNDFGGIEVSKGSLPPTNSILTVTGTLINSSEAYGKPTIWLVTTQGAVTGVNVPATTSTAIVAGQTQYYLVSGNAVDPALALSNATASVVTAEGSPTQGNVDAAQTLVTALPDGAAKIALQGRISTVQGIIDAATALDAAKTSILVLSPVVTTVVPAVATVVVPETVPVNEQFGGDASSEQGEVKADTTIKPDDQKPSDNNDQNTETKEKKNIPLWGIIFLLVLAGIGGYLFYSQNPETNTKGTKKK